MAGQTGSGCQTQVQADIEVLGTEKFLQPSNHSGYGDGQFRLLVEGKPVKASHVPLWRYQEMSIVVRVPIDHRNGQGSALDDQASPIVAIGRGTAEETLRISVGQQAGQLARFRFRRTSFDEFQPPGSPNSFVFHANLPSLIGVFGSQLSACRKSVTLREQ
jgi:hypothetical protein